MRFAALQGSSVSDYAAAGKKVANEAADSFTIMRRSGPNYQKIAETGMKARSAEKIAAMQAGAAVTKAGINAFTDVKKTVIRENTRTAIRDIKDSRRKAGGIAALGKVAAAGFLMRDNDKRKPPSNLDAKKAAWEKWKNERDATLAQRDSARTDYKPGDPLSTGNLDTGNSGTGGNTGGTAGKSTGGVSPANKSEFGNAYMNLLTQSGMSKSQAAALTGHLEVESDSFRADTEYAPNAYGTRGRGHLQWTDTGNSGGRRTNFESFASSKGLDPKSFEANSQFLLSEMQGNHGNHWTNGGSYQGFLNTGSLEEASAYLQNNYIRPGVPHTERRLGAARNYFNSFNN